MLPQEAFTGADVRGRYPHRGSFENALSDEKILSKTPIVGATLPPGVRSAGKSLLNGSGTCGWNWVIASILIPCARQTSLLPSQLGRLQLPDPASPVQGYRPAEVALGWKAGRFSGRDFAFQADGTLCCPANQKLSAHERRRGSRWEPACRVRCQHSQLPSLSSARNMPMAGQGDSESRAQVSVLLHPLKIGVGSSPVAGLEPRRYRQPSCTSCEINAWEVQMAPPLSLAR